MRIKLWGVRGSLPSPLQDKEYRKKLHLILEIAIEKSLSNNSEIDNFINSLPLYLKNVYGGNTTCVTVTTKKGNLYILDCGTGIRPVGDFLMKGESSRGKAKIPIFITHTHWDHIQGLPFFKPIYVPGNILNFYSPYSDLYERLSYQQETRYFPVKLDEMASTKNFHTLTPNKPLELEENFYVDFYPLKHPGGSYAYRFIEDDRTFIFATDAEFTGDYLEQLERKTDFFMNADLLILDSQYTLNESFRKFDWGHTSYTMAVNCGIHWNVKHLVLTHHEPSYSDFKLNSIHTYARSHKKQMNEKYPLIHLATEGMSFVIGE